MQNETRQCQNCKNDFTIESEDFSFYEKMQVPAPTFCPACRMQRRNMFRNERTLYKSACGLCNKNIITIFNPETTSKIYCGKCWWGDDWDGTEYAMDYDPNRNFFDQLKELSQKTPYMNLIVAYATLVNSEYVNHVGSSKNCFLIFNADFCENVYHSTTLEHVRDSSDCIMMNKTELSYECIGGDGSGVYFSENCPESVNVWYSKDCVGCTDCFGCVNLRNQSNYIFNVPYSKEDFNQKMKEMELDKYSSHLKIREKIYDFWNKFPRRYAYGRMNKNTTGEYVYNSKNAKDCYQTVSAEDVRYCQFITLPTFRDCYDISEWGANSEMCIENITAGDGIYDVKYSSGAWDNVRNVEYSMYVINSNSCFGCVNLRKKEYCILNKQYTKEEYFKLKEKIIEDMNQNPYVDSMGRVWKYGEFLPYDLSPFTYNTSFASQYFPLSKEEILKNGWKYEELKATDYEPTIASSDIPDSIFDIPDDFAKEVLPCGSCNKMFRIAQGELILLKRLILPVPRQCPDCRHKRRLNRLNKPFLFDRKCDKCQADIKTSYAPDRPEIVYCEKCYQQEVY